MLWTDGLLLQLSVTLCLRVFSGHWSFPSPVKGQGKRLANDDTRWRTNIIRYRKSLCGTHLSLRLFIISDTWCWIQPTIDEHTCLTSSQVKKQNINSHPRKHLVPFPDTAPLPRTTVLLTSNPIDCFLQLLNFMWVELYSICSPMSGFLHSTLHLIACTSYWYMQ